jgi:hypothetical protein
MTAKSMITTLDTGVITANAKHPCPCRHHFCCPERNKEDSAIGKLSNYFCTHYETNKTDSYKIFNSVQNVVNYTLRQAIYISFDACVPRRRCFLLQCLGIIATMG